MMQVVNPVRYQDFSLERATQVVQEFKEDFADAVDKYRALGATVTR